MKTLCCTLIIVCLLLTNPVTHANNSYLDKFATYSRWSEHLPSNINPDFIAFIEAPSPLTQKLREKWLYQLAWNKDWQRFSKFYRHSPDIALQCYQSLALYQLNQRAQATHMANQLLLSGHTLPAGCAILYRQMLQNHEISTTLIGKRIELALEEKHVSLAADLLKQLTPPRNTDALLLRTIEKQPKQIRLLMPGPYHGAFYLYGLRRLILSDSSQAIKLFKNKVAQQLLNQDQRQLFLRDLTIQRAIEHHADTEFWFSQIKPGAYDSDLLEWMIRDALFKKEWQLIIKVAMHAQKIDDPYCQYWLARALAATGQPTKAHAILQHLSLSRNYYGFLASNQLRQAMHFQEEPINHNHSIKYAYQKFIAELQSLHRSQQDALASKRLYDFISELPKEQKIRLLLTVAHQMNWYGKTIYLSSADDMKDQLLLRFPLVYLRLIQQLSQNYGIPAELILAIIRQESAFRDDIVSSAGAKGLMQLMPQTAALIAKREKIAYRTKQDLFLSSKNINIGVAYLHELAKHFHGHPLLMAAAYNAGPRQVSYWISNHPPQDIDIWIETLPWKETRNYLKNIIAFYAVYQYRMHTKPDLQIFMRPVRQG